MQRESYGEDIANTDTDGSTHCADEDEYEDSFIDDSNPEVFPPSPGSSDEGIFHTSCASFSSCELHLDEIWFSGCSAFYWKLSWRLIYALHEVVS